MSLLPFAIHVLRHASEQHKTSNSARLAALAIKPLVITPYGERDKPLSLSLPPKTWLLFPADEPNLPSPSDQPDALLVLDGTWAQVRRMLRRVEGLAALPRLSLPQPTLRGAFLRKSEQGISTFEAITEAIAAREGESITQPLRLLFQEFVQRTQRARGR
jgi:DTW domain-containing protein YfiP